MQNCRFYIVDPVLWKMKCSPAWKTVFTPVRSHRKVPRGELVGEFNANSSLKKTANFSFPHTGKIRFANTVSVDSNKGPQINDFVHYFTHFDKIRAESELKFANNSDIHPKTISLDTRELYGSHNKLKISALLVQLTIDWTTLIFSETLIFCVSFSSEKTFCFIICKPRL